jgi:hypothetical protein
MVILRPKHGIRMTFTNTIAPARRIAADAALPATSKH